MFVFVWLCMGWGGNCNESGYFCSGTPSTSFSLSDDRSASGNVIVVDAFGSVVEVCDMPLKVCDCKIQTN
jgi:hypothetical protein